MNQQHDISALRRQALEGQGQAELDLIGLRLRPLPKPSLTAEFHACTLQINAPQAGMLYFPSVGTSFNAGLDEVLRSCCPETEIPRLKEAYPELCVVRAEDVGLTRTLKQTRQTTIVTGEYILAARKASENPKS